MEPGTQKPPPVSGPSVCHPRACLSSGKPHGRSDRVAQQWYE